MEYLYDGSFNGLLTCIYKNYYEEAASGIYQRAFYQPTLMMDNTVVVTDNALAHRVYEAIRQKISEDSLKLIYHTYLSAEVNKENLILNYLRLGFRMGPKINLYHSHPYVQPITKASHQVTGEAHRFLGLLRFADTGRFLYAAFSPDNNIITLVADHFADRLASERWIIHDQKRKLAVVYNGQNLNKEKSSLHRQWYLTDLPLNYELSLPKEEQYYQELWQRYFSKIAVKSRCNPRLQSQFVPLRYRSYLTEFQVLEKNNNED